MNQTVRAFLGFPRSSRLTLTELAYSRVEMEEPKRGRRSEYLPAVTGPSCYKAQIGPLGKGGRGPFGAFFGAPAETKEMLEKPVAKASTFLRRGRPREKGQFTSQEVMKSHMENTVIFLLLLDLTLQELSPSQL